MNKNSINRDQAILILNKMLSNKSLIIHSYSVALVMEYYGKELNENGKRTHTGRFIGSLIADFHRNMLKGGVFIYPTTSDRPNGQLRLIYECNPIAFIAEASEGKSTNLKINILDTKPKSIHERAAFAVGSKDMINRLLSFYNL